MMKKIAFIGAGPANLMAIATLLELNAEIQISLFEKNSSMCKKLLITGGGRCNLTTALSDRKQILANYTRGGNFLKFALANFSPQKVCAWFLSHGLRTKVEKNNKIFPQSDNSCDVLAVFEKIFANKNNLAIQLNTLVKNAYSDKNNKFIVEFNDTKEEFDMLVVGSGGLGNSYDFAKQFGHSVTKIAPSLTSFEAKENWARQLSGISLVDCQLKFNLQGQKKMNIKGDLVFTHFGISGPAVFALSSFLAFEKIDPENPIIIFLIIDPKKDFVAWDNILQEKINSSGSKMVKNILGEFLPNRFVDQILILLKIDAQKKMAELKKEERKSIAKVLGEGLEITLISRKNGEGMVTAGGIDLGQIDPKSCESKIHPNLYFVGEILDIDGVTGGFNLQNSWMTGRLAAENIYQKLI